MEELIGDGGDDGGGPFTPEDGPGPPSDEEVANEELDWN